MKQIALSMVVATFVFGGASACQKDVTPNGVSPQAPKDAMPASVVVPGGTVVIGTTMALLVRPGTNPSFETAAYYNSPFEAQAYQAEGKYPPSTWNSSQKELMWW